MDAKPAWLPDGLLGPHIPPETADGIINLARSPNPADTDLLMRIGMTQGLRHPRFAIDAIAVERELSHAREMRRLEWTLVTFVPALGAADAGVFVDFPDLAREPQIRRPTPI
jgi:hypothetical protein